MVVRLPSDLDVTDSNNTTIPNSSGSSDNIAEGNPPSTVNNCTRSLAAIIAAMWGGMYSGSSRPSAVQSGSVWRDTSGGATAHVIKYYDGTDDISLITINTTANTISLSATLTGNVTGNVTGNADTATALNTVLLAAAGISDLVGIASQAEAEAGTDNTKAATSLRVRQAIDDRTQVFETTAASLPANDTETTPVSTGFDSLPHLVWAELECTTADLNWTVGDRLYFGGTFGDGSNRGIAIVASGTDSVSIKTGLSGVATPNQSGGTGALTPASWNYVIRAVKYGAL